MEYFQYLCFILGIMILLSSLWIMIFTENYRSVAQKMLPTKRQHWILPVNIVWLALIVFTWIKYSQNQTPVTLLISIILSLTIAKVYAITFRYPKYREFALTFIGVDVLVLKTLGMIYFALGSALIAIGYAL